MLKERKFGTNNIRERRKKNNKNKCGYTQKLKNKNTKKHCFVPDDRCTK